MELIDVMVVIPATGNTMGKLAHGINDNVSTVAIKTHLKNDKPVVIGICTNDALRGCAESIGKLLNRKNFYFIPFMQDNPITKPYSLVFNHNLVIKTVELALEHEQIQPMLV